MKREITIYAQILDDNLGDGWTDNYEAAKALAKFTENIWREELEDTYDVKIEIDVEKNTSGASRGVEIWAPTFEIMADVKSTMSDENTIWDRFCDSEIAEDFSE